MAKAYRSGRPRREQGQRAWRVRAYTPGPGFPRGRVVFKGEAGDWATRTPDDGQSLDQLFDQVERGLDHNVALTSRASNGNFRDLNALAERYYAYLKAKGSDPDYINNRRCLLDKWFLREHGSLAANKWGPELSQRIISSARERLSPQRIEDLGVAMSGLRKTGWRPDENGLRWLARDFDPLEDVGYSKGSNRGRARFVERSQRPDTQAVLSVILVTRQRASDLQAPGLAEQVELAGFGGLRLSEQLGLRVDDLRPTNCEVSINGVWLDPHGELARRRPFTKTRENRTTPLPPATFTRLQALSPLAKQRLRQRKALAKEAVAAGNSALAKWIVEENHAFLFCNPLTLWPWTQEEFNNQWRKTVNLSRQLAKHEPETFTPWPKRVLYRNMRHHSATWWHEELGTPWQQVAIQLGNSYKTVLDHYVLTSEGDRRAALDALAKVELPSLEQLKV